MILFSRFLSILLMALLSLSPLQAQAVVQGLQMRLVQGNTQATTGATDGQGLVIEVTDASGTPVSGAAVSLRLPEDGATGIFADGTRSAVAYTDSSGRAQIRGILWGATPGIVPMRVTATNGTAHAGMLIEEKLTPAPAGVAPAPQPLAAQPASVQPASVTAKPASVPAEPDAPPAVQPHVSIQPPSAPLSSGRSSSTEPAIAVVPKDTAAPAVSITGGTDQAGHSGSKKKWIILAIVAAAAAGGAAAMMGGKSKSSTANNPSSPLTIGSPSVSIGAP
jgi:hypothetical protein